MTDTPSAPTPSNVAEIISDAGGRVVGRTKLQKIAYFLEATGVGSGFEFEYRHYGPYCEELANAARLAKFLGYIDETEAPATWGGSYSIYTTAISSANTSEARRRVISISASANSIALELAATAAFLAVEGHQDPWGETSRRKPEKASDSRLNEAKALYSSLCQVKTPTPLPGIA